MFYQVRYGEKVDRDEQFISTARKERTSGGVAFDVFQDTSADKAREVGVLIDQIVSLAEDARDQALLDYLDQFRSGDLAVHGEYIITGAITYAQDPELKTRITQLYVEQLLQEGALTAVIDTIVSANKVEPQVFYEASWIEDFYQRAVATNPSHAWYIAHTMNTQRGWITGVTTDNRKDPTKAEAEISATWAQRAREIFPQHVEAVLSYQPKAGQIHPQLARIFERIGFQLAETDLDVQYREKLTELRRQVARKLVGHHLLHERTWLALNYAQKAGLPKKEVEAIKKAGREIILQKIEKQFKQLLARLRARRANQTQGQ